VRLEVTQLEDRLVPANSNYQVVDIIPHNQSNETDQNSEPNIAVNPTNPSQAAMGVFGASPNPYFSTQDGGKTWTNFQNLTHSDESVAWTKNGNLYASLLDNSGSNTIDIFQSPSPNNPPNLLPINTLSATSTPDQPWLEAATVAGQDHIYVGFNDLSQFPSGNTASLHYSTDGGATWQTVVIEQNGTPAVGQDGPNVREAIKGNTVYAIFQRWKANVGGNNYQSDLVVVKDTNGGNGLTPFTDLGANGVVVAPNIIDALGTSFGTNRTGSDISIAVDPNNANRVAVAYVNQTISGGPTHVEVRISTDGGLTWGSGPVLSINPNSALPAIAIAANGTIGLLYAADVGGQIQMHLVQSFNNFRSKTDQPLFYWNDTGIPTPTSQPYIGDWFDINAVGNKFYGTFCATNDLTTAVLPVGINLQRNFVGTPGTASFDLRDTTGLNPVAFSIDPYFFSATAFGPMIKVYYPVRYTYLSGKFQGYLTLVTTSSFPVPGPIFVLFPRLPSGVTLANASGFDNGIPYRILNTTLQVNQPGRLFVSFNDPRHVSLSTFFFGFPVVVTFQLF
jgi:hypothetical protein